MINSQNCGWRRKNMSEKQKKMTAENIARQDEPAAAAARAADEAIVENFCEQIAAIAENLYYLSETDAEILPFKGTFADKVTADELLKQTKHDADVKVAAHNFDEFFERLVKIQDWFGEEEKAAAARFSELKQLLENNLRDLTVFKIGKIRLDVYVVGLGAENILTGIQTKAVET